MDKRIIMVNRTGIGSSLEGDFVMYIDNEFPYCLEEDIQKWTLNSFGIEFTEFGSYNDGQTSYLIGIVNSRHKRWPDCDFREVQWLRVKSLNPDSNKDSGIIKHLKDHFS